MGNRSATTIMIVDDELFFRSVLREILERSGYSVVAEAVDGNDALEKYRQLRPDLTIMDIFMPEKYGVPATREILEFDAAARVVVCSATGFDDEVAAAFEAGARAMILKPFLESEIIETIDKVMQES